MQTKGDEFSFFDEQNNSLSQKIMLNILKLKKKL